MAFSSAFAQDADSRIVNLSTRMRVAPGSALVTGFAISGTEPRPILVRAVGPGLAQFGLSDVLANPRLELRATDGRLLASNRGWNNDAGLAAAFAQAGAFALAAGGADSAAMLMLEPGGYTLNVLAGEGEAGAALAEIYDLGEASPESQLVNASSLSTIPSGAEAISGFILAGDAPRDFLMRGVGPGLSMFGVGGVLLDPMLTVFDASGRPIASDHDWSGYPQATTAVVPANPGEISPVTPATPGTPISPITPAQPSYPGGFRPLPPEHNEASVRLASARSGAFPLERFSKDAAMVLSLHPGAYTVQIKGMPFAPFVVPAGGASQEVAAAVAQAAAAAASVARRVETVSASTGGLAGGAPSGVPSAGPSFGGDPTIVEVATVSAVAVPMEPAATGVALFELYALPR